MCEICRFEPPRHAPWCPCRPEMKPDEQALRELAKQMVETNKMKRQEVITPNATSNFSRIAELEAENKRLRGAGERLVAMLEFYGDGLGPAVVLCASEFRKALRGEG